MATSKKRDADTLPVRLVTGIIIVLVPVVMVSSCVVIVGSHKLFDRIRFPLHNLSQYYFGEERYILNALAGYYWDSCGPQQQRRMFVEVTVYPACELTIVAANAYPGSETEIPKELTEMAMVTNAKQVQRVQVIFTRLVYVPGPVTLADKLRTYDIILCHDGTTLVHSGGKMTYCQ
jgi:hypothetical protein